MISKFLILFLFVLMSVSFSAFGTQVSDGQIKEVKETVRKFYRWYADHEEPLAQFKFYRQVKEPAGSPHQTHNELNGPELERYFAELKKAPALSEAFLAAHREFFKSCEAGLKKTYDDDVPPCFDYDWMTQSNGLGASDVLQLLSAAQVQPIPKGESIDRWVLRIPKTVAKTKLQEFLRIALKQEPDGLKIIKIDTEEFIQTPDFAGVVFNTYQETIEGGIATWRLTEQDIVSAEEILKTCIAEAQKKPDLFEDEKKGWPIIAKNLSAYKRQYTGIEVARPDGKNNGPLIRVVWVNAFQNDSLEEWREKLYTVIGGGYRYFSARIDLEGKRCQHLRINASR